MKPALFSLCKICALCVIIAPSIHAIDVALPVKRGQQSVDPKLLPFACLGITTDGAALPLERVVLQNEATKKKHTAIFGKAFGERNILTATEAGSRSHSLAIMQLSPGRYRLLKLEFVIPTRDISSMNFDFSKERNFSFTVEPGKVNYVGSLVIRSNWSGIRLPHVNTFTGGYAETSFSASYWIVDTAARDAKWAADVVPAMAQLPQTVSLLE